MRKPADNKEAPKTALTSNALNQLNRSQSTGGKSKLAKNGAAILSGDKENQQINAHRSYGKVPKYLQKYNKERDEKEQLLI